MDLTQIEIDGNKLKALREGKRLTLKEVGDAVGVERGTVYNYEAGHANPSSNIAARLCIFFDVTIQEITNQEKFSNLVS